MLSSSAALRLIANTTVAVRFGCNVAEKALFRSTAQMHRICSDPTHPLPPSPIWEFFLVPKYLCYPKYQVMLRFNALDGLWKTLEIGHFRPIIFCG